jgi:transposase
MYIRVTKAANGNTQKVYLVEGYRDEDKKIKQRIVRCYGELSKLQSAEPGVLARLRAEAKAMKQDSLIQLELDGFAKNSACGPVKNYGYIFLDRIFSRLGLRDFFEQVASERKFVYDLKDIIRLLTYSRILAPGSKKEAFEQRGIFFEDFDGLELEDIYRSLSVMDKIKDELQFHLHKAVSSEYGRDCTLVFYDVTNYYFETEREDEMRKKGVSKEYRPNPLVQMGLFLDGNGIPIAYKLFPGNTNDKATLLPAIKDVRTRYGLGKIVVVGDKGTNTGANTAYLVQNGDGYILSQQIRKRKAELIERVLDEAGYVPNAAGTFKKKSWIGEKTVADEHGNSVLLKEKVVCFWSKDYADREKHKRGNIEGIIEKFRDNPTLYTASNSFGVKKYLKEQHLDKETGVVQKKNPVLFFDQEKYARDCALDGYYMLVTSELDMTDEEIIEQYRGLYKVEDSFRVLKSDLEGRPVYVRTESHIEGHFLVCFLALVLMRLLQKETGDVFTAEQLQRGLLSASCHHIDKNIYLLQKQNPAFQKLYQAHGIDLDKKYLKIEQIRNLKKALTQKNTTS